jgi:hypothetical protein
MGSRTSAAVLFITTATLTSQDKLYQPNCYFDASSCIVSLSLIRLRTIDFGNPALAVQVKPPAGVDGSKVL